MKDDAKYCIEKKLKSYDFLSFYESHGRFIKIFQVFLK